MASVIMAEVHAYYPLMLDVVHRCIVIVGGGDVAIRKARGLINAGATNLIIVSPTVRDGIPATVRIIAERFESRHLEGAALVFAATDSAEVNDAVVREAHRRGVMVNRADSSESTPGDFSTPAAWREGPMTLTVSTDGSPALAAMVRDELASRIDPGWISMAAAMTTLRPMMLSKMTPVRRREAFRDLATGDAIKQLGDGMDALRRWLEERYPELR